MDGAASWVWGAIPMLLCLSCGSPAAPAGSFLPPPEDLSSLPYNDVKSHFLAMHLEGGQVVSRSETMAAENVGDSLLFTGIALASLPCGEGAAIEDALRQMVDTYGTFVRFNPLPAEYVGGHEVSFDGVVGVTFGFASRMARCPADAPTLRAIWDKHVAYVKAHKGELYAGTGAYMGVVSYPWDVLSGGGGNTRTAMEVGTWGWAKATVNQKASCYRIHLATLLLLASAYEGNAPDKAAFCQATNNTDIPLTDWLCSRRTAMDYLTHYQGDAWEYRSQRCGAWESPDGQGFDNPWLDYLLIYVLGSRS